MMTDSLCSTALHVAKQSLGRWKIIVALTDSLSSTALHVAEQSLVSRWNIILENHIN